MNENFISEVCNTLGECPGTTLLDNYLFQPSQDGMGTLIMVCSQEDIEQTRQSALQVAASNKAVSGIRIYYVGPGNEHFKGDARGIYIDICNLCWAWYDDYGLLFDEDQFGGYIRFETANRICKDLTDMPVGDGEAYENIVEDILRFSLPTAIDGVWPKVAAYDRIKVRDIKVKLRPGCVLQQHIQRASLSSNNILFEAKNKETVTAGDVSQIAGYLGPTKFASVGFLVTRKVLSHGFHRHVVDVNRNMDERKIIVPVHDNDLVLLLDNAANGNFGGNEHLLIQRIEDTLNLVY